MVGNFKICECTGDRMTHHPDTQKCRFSLHYKKLASSPSNFVIGRTMYVLMVGRRVVSIVARGR